MINFGPISNVVGVLLLIVGSMMLTAIPFSLYHQSGDIAPLLISAVITILAGALAWFYKFRSGAQVNKREGYLIVALGWLSMVTFGALPYVLSGVLPHPVDAFFETVSGMTTTGASVLTDIESVPKGILFWRSMTQWLGGMGIIVLTVAIFPLLGFGGIELFVAEAPGPTSDKLHPRIQVTAKRLWLLYVSLTAALCLLLWAEGMTFYEAINHALTTMATGGFSTRNASIAAFPNPLMQYTLILFMFLAGTNYSMIYYMMRRKWKRVWSNEEFKVYLALVLLLAITITPIVMHHSAQDLERSFRDTLFQVVSLITTTGYVSADYTSWGTPVLIVCVALLFLGASAGSTAGGIKIIRHIVFFKNSLNEFKKLLHPQAVIPLKLNGQPVATRIAIHILVFLLLYLSTFFAGTLIVSIMGLDFETAIGTVATSLGNVGPGIGKVGPTDNFAWLPQDVKFVLSLLMLLGRLELFTLLVIFTPYFWKLN
ncbi:MAG TPA: TrkH family potassium uptake protein [Phaeodactylibacter sp.]|nr:TrkH family potassium uptake protein [Phaeodactylibacter sp.]